MTLLLFELDGDHPVEKGYMQRANETCENAQCPCDAKDTCIAEHGKGYDQRDSVTDDMLAFLAPDFMNFESRAKDLVQKKMLYTGWFREIMKVIPAILVAFGLGYLGYLGIDARVDNVAKAHLKLDQELKTLTDRIDDVEYYDKIKLKDRVGEIEEQLKLKEPQQQNEVNPEDEGS